MVDLSSNTGQRQDDLVKLLCTMQSSLLFWCKHLFLVAITDTESKQEEEKYSKILKGVEDILLQCKSMYCMYM